MRKITRLFVFGAAALALASASTAEAKLKRITIGSNKQGSVYFLLASGFAKTLQQKLKIRSTAQPHAGSSVYVPLVNKGEITMGLNNSMDSGAAVRGKPPFPKKLPNVRAIARVWVLPYAYMVRADSPIKSMADLKGKRVVIDVKTVLSLAALNKAMLEGAGVSVNDVTPVDSAGVVQNIDLVVEGRADAATVAASMPAVRKAHATAGIRLLSLDPRTTDAFLSARAPGSSTLVRPPAKPFPFIKKTQTIASFHAYLNASTHMADEDAYAIAKALHEEWKNMQKAYAPLRSVPANGVAPASNPHLYHPGAVKYYKEVGLWSADNSKNEAALEKELK